MALAITLALLIGTFINQLLSFINHDTAWYLHAGAQYLEGGELYRDVFVEVNPPLGFFLALPPVILARLSGLFAVDLFVVYFYGLIVVSLLVTWRLLSADHDLAPASRRGLLILATVIMTICPADQFGQREHFLMVLVLPYLVLAVLTARGLRLSWAAAMGLGLAAGLGFALKPHYLLVPLALEAYRFAATRRWQTLLRPETLGLAATVAIYAAVVVWVTPEYLSRILPYALEVYNQAYRNPLWVVLWRIETVMLPVGCIVHFATRRNQQVPELGDVFMIASSVFFIAYVAQMKGWSYHLYPASTCLILGYGALFLNHLTAPRGEAAAPVPRSLTRGIAAASLVVIAILAGNDAAHLGYKNRFTDIMAPYVERYAANGSIAILGSNVWPGFPLGQLQRGRLVVALPNALAAARHHPETHERRSCQSRLARRNRELYPRVRGGGPVRPTPRRDHRRRSREKILFRRRAHSTISPISGKTRGLRASGRTMSGLPKKSGSTSTAAAARPPVDPRSNQARSAAMEVS